MTLESRDDVQSTLGTRLGRRKGDDPLDDMVGVARLDALEDMRLELADERVSLLVAYLFEGL
jgi:hypothetical protein